MFEFRCPLRWSDLDAQGHVNNALVVDYLQEARVAFFKSGPASQLLDEGIVVVGHQVEYLAPIDYRPEGLDVELVVAALGGARFEITYVLRQGDRPVARARTVLCPFDFGANRPVRIPDDVREYLGAHLAEVEPLRELATPRLDGRGSATDLFVRWSDHDSYAHVNNSKTYDYIQQARVVATAQWDPTMARVGQADSQHLWLVARQDVDYVAQLTHRMEPFAVLTAPVRLGTSSVTLASEIVDPGTGTVFNRGRTVLVCADTRLRPTALPESTRVALERRLVA
ncbi:acyl-CoA thioesterase [Tessaracoccus rhinocerotis]|uniref:acyl-CoA thioesterase n=1 Tax=Tessaracoccus rhinocerotis TaxID=1689449 RepID=UPI00163D8C3E|nr:thioesterase family protein [Tessaracoccus rhinocerotis]